MATTSGEFKPLLSQSIGYGVVVGVGFFFAALMLLLTWFQSKFTRLSPGSSEEFTSASRNVKPGLICCGIVSAWTHSTTVLQSNTAAYTYGVSAPWWYGVGGTIQVFLFTMIAAKIKMNANGAHTFLEIVKVRFGTPAHILFTFYGALCNLVVCGSLILGGAATVNALTGMNIDAACFLLPIGIADVVFGGLRATFICDWTHTFIMFVIIYIFLFRVYATSPDIGSTTEMYNLLVDAARTTPVVGNQDGSYLTMKSNGGIVFGAATIVTASAGLFCDQGFWQRAIASAPETTTKAYMLGGISWFSVPWALSSCLGLAARALIKNPKFPTYPFPLSASQASAGLAGPAAATVLLGKGGAVAMLLMVFMAVTSAASAELIAVSSIFSYDVYRTYFHKDASGSVIVRVTHYFIAGWAIWMGAWAVIVSQFQPCIRRLPVGALTFGISFTGHILIWDGGVVLSPAVIPIALTITWGKLSNPGLFAGTLTGFVTGMAAWMVGCLKIYGKINIPNLALPYSAVCSGATSLFFSGVFTVAVSLLYPAHYDFAGTRAIRVIDPVGDDMAGASTPLESLEKEDIKKEKHDVTKIVSPSPSVGHGPAAKEYPIGVSMQELRRIFKRAAWLSLVLTFIVTLLVPIPMFLSHYIFSQKFFRFWITCSIIWALSSGIFCILLPLWESRAQMASIVLRCAGYFRPKADASHSSNAPRDMA